MNASTVGDYDLGELETSLTALGPVATEEFCNLLSSPLGVAEVRRLWLLDLRPAFDSLFQTGELLGC